MKKKFLIAIVLVFMFAAGMLVGGKFFNGGGFSNRDSQTEIDREKKEQDKNEPGGVQDYEEKIRVIGGVVEKVDGRKITIKTDMATSPGEDNDLNVRIAEVSADARVVNIVEKDGQQFKREMAEYREKIKEYQALTATPENPVSPPDFPNRFDTSETELSTVKEGSFVSLVAEEDIKSKKEFVATEVVVGKLSELPPVNEDVSGDEPAPTFAPGQ